MDNTRGIDPKLSFIWCIGIELFLLSFDDISQNKTNKPRAYFSVTNSFARHVLLTPGWNSFYFQNWHNSPYQDAKSKGASLDGDLMTVEATHCHV